MKQKNKSKAQHRLTGLYMLRRPLGGSGYGLPRSVATLHSHGKPPPQFVGPKNATHFSIRAAKPSYTAGTLCAIASELVLKYIDKK
jgi:hypothetical protein